jgi:DNA-directed RNA polymerase subunit RPC12/RpoP
MQVLTRMEDIKMYKAECPYCEHDNEIELDGCEEWDHECENCGEEFEITIEYDPIINTNKIIYKECIDCKREYRYTGQSFPQPNKYKNIAIEEYYVCENCYCTEHFKDWESKRENK